MQSAVQPQAHDEPGEGQGAKGDIGDGGGEGDAGPAKVVALHPHPAGGERAAPVLLDVATTAGKVDLLAVDGQRADQLVVQPQHAMIALQKGQPAKGAHNAGGKPGHGPAYHAVKADRAFHGELGAGEVQGNLMQVKDALLHPHLEGLGVCGEGIGRISKVVGRPVHPVEYLHKAMLFAWLKVVKNARDEGPALLLAGVDQLTVPPLKVGRLFAVAVISLRVRREG